MAIARITGIVQGEFGKTITLQLRHPTTGAIQNISGYGGNIYARVRSPDGGNLVVRTAAFTTDGTDGKISWNYVANDIDRAGIWEGTIELFVATDTQLAKSYLFEMHVGEAV